MSGLFGVFFQYFGLFASCGLPFILAAVGLLVGTMVERAHLRRLDEAEAKLLTIPLTDLKTQPSGVNGGAAMMVSGSVVVATDYFRTVAAMIRKIIGGEIWFYNRLLMRGRREAICRMMAEAKRMNALAVINVRLETSNVGGMAKNPAPMVEVLAYGTAILPEEGYHRVHRGGSN